MHSYRILLSLSTYIRIGKAKIDEKAEFICDK